MDNRRQDQRLSVDLAVEIEARDWNDVLVLSTDSEFLRYLGRSR